MRNKAFAPLIEQICMIAVFAIVAAVCIGGFSLSYNISRETERTDAALLLAQNTAEQLKSGAITLDGKQITLFYDEDLQPADTHSGVYTVSITPAEQVDALLAGAQIRVRYAGAELFALTVHWQEGMQR